MEDRSAGLVSKEFSDEDSGHEEEDEGLSPSSAGSIVAHDLDNLEARIHKPPDEDFGHEEEDESVNPSSLESIVAYDLNNLEAGVPKSPDEAPVQQTSFEEMMLDREAAWNKEKVKEWLLDQAASFRNGR